MILTEWHVRGIHFPMDVEESDWGIEISDDEEEKAKNKKAHMGGLVVEGLGDRLENILEPGEDISIRLMIKMLIRFSVSVGSHVLDASWELARSCLRTRSL